SKPRSCSRRTSRSGLRTRPQYQAVRQRADVLDDQRARVASKCFEALFSNFIAFIADWQDIRAEPQLLVPGGGIRQFNGINGLGCPTVTNLPIESTCLFSRLSHPFWSRRATSRSFSVSSILNSRAAASTW